MGIVVRQHPSTAKGSVKGHFIRPARHFTSHPAYIQTLQEADSKLEANWEQRHFHMQFTVLSCFVKPWEGETLCCTVSIQRSLWLAYKKSKAKAWWGLHRDYKQKTLNNIAVLCSVGAAVLVYISSAKLSHTAASGGRQETCKPHNCEEADLPGSLCFCFVAVSWILESDSKAWS